MTMMIDEGADLEAREEDGGSTSHLIGTIHQMSKSGASLATSPIALLEAGIWAQQGNLPPGHKGNRRHLLSPVVQRLSFSNFDFHGLDKKEHDPIMIYVVGGNYIVKKVLVD